MKKRFYTLLLAGALAVSALTSTVFAQTNNRIDRIATAKSGISFNEDSAPVLIIEKSQDMQGKFSFELSLKNAEWNYGDSGNISDGIDYRKIGDSTLLIQVSEQFDGENNDIRIPMVVEITGNEDAEVTIDSNATGVSSGTYTFSNGTKDTTTISIESVETVTNTQKLKPIIIEDIGMKKVSKNEKLTLKLSNGFKFNSVPTLECSGRYDGTVEFVIDKDDPETAYIVATKDTSNDTGKIIINDLEIAPSQNQRNGTVYLTLTNNKGNANIAVANYKKMDETQEKPIEISEVTGNLRPVIKGKASPGRMISVDIDKTFLENVKVDANGNWEVTYKEDLSDLTEGKHTITAGYYKSSTDSTTGIVTYDYTAEKAVEQPKEEPKEEPKPEPEKIEIVFKIGEKTYKKGTEEISLDSAAFIDENNRTMLPLRAVANALGISDNNIAWDEATQTVVITKDNAEKISITLGKNEIDVNGTIQTIDAKAVSVDGRTFLPLRAVLNVLGITDDNITWNEADKSVTILK